MQGFCFLRGLCSAMRSAMKCRMALFLIVVVLAGWLERQARADTFELNDKTVLTGQPLAPDKRGIIIKAEDGTIPDRVPWTNFTQGALKKLYQLPAAKPFVEPYLEPDEPEPSRKKAPEIT